MRPLDTDANNAESQSLRNRTDELDTALDISKTNVPTTLALAAMAHR